MALSTEIETHAGGFRVRLFRDAEVLDSAQAATLSQAQVLGGVMLRGEYARRMAQRVRAQNGHDVALPCPECADKGPHDSNGSSQDPGACCRACGAHFDVDGP